MIKKIVSGILSVLVLSTTLCGCSISSSILKSSSKESYESKLFDDSYVHEINIEIAEDDWNELLENPTDKTKYKANLTIDGEKYSEVSFATKGNTSLSEVASDSTTDRYSFKINFDKYVDDQTYYGLDKLNLNNVMSDATYMKDYLSYHFMNEMGVAAPLSSYVKVSVNGEARGLYVAIEGVSDSFLERNYGDEEGDLYKPETAMLGNMGGKDKGGEGKEGFDPANMTEEDKEKMKDKMDNNMQDKQKQDGTTTPMNPDDSKEGRQGFNKDNMEGGFGSSSSGASLAYTDDEVDSYSDIFDNAETDVTDEDKERLIKAIKELNEGDDLDSCLDVNQVIKYFVVHNFVDNYDSYTGNMLHNYYLYEDEGKMSIIPWDYNLAFGAFARGGMGDRGRVQTGENSESKDLKNETETEDTKPSEGDSNSEGMTKPGMVQGADNQNLATSSADTATQMVNYAIDTPLSGATEDQRVLWSAIINNDECKELYHKYFNEFISDYFESGDFEEEIDKVYEMIRPYVEDDATAFYTVDEFDTAYKTIKEFCLLRTESIRKQLNGDIPSTTDKQNEEGVNLVDASSINIKDMGTQSGGRGMDQSDKNKMPNDTNMQYGGEMPKGKNQQGGNKQGGNKPGGNKN